MLPDAVCHITKAVRVLAGMEGHCAELQAVLLIILIDGLSPHVSVSLVSPCQPGPRIRQCHWSPHRILSANRFEWNQEK